MCAFCRRLIRADEEKQLHTELGADGVRQLFHPRCYTMWLGARRETPAG
jgi:hypothetical protein